MANYSLMSRLILVTAACWVLVSACEHESFFDASQPPLGVDTIVGSGPSGKICFEKDILPIFTTSCTGGGYVQGCHDAASHSDDYVFDNAKNIISKGIKPFRPEDSDVYEALIEDGDDKMPQPPFSITNEQIGLIWQWIKEGADTTKNCNTAVCDTAVVTYSGTIVPLMTAKGCYPCHQGTNPVGKWRLTSYDELKAMGVNGKLIPAVDRTGPFPMPKPDEAKLDPCEVAKFRVWVRRNYPR